jgi:hypothetical protein
MFQLKARSISGLIVSIKQEISTGFVGGEVIAMLKIIKEEYGYGHEYDFGK